MGTLRQAWWLLRKDATVELRTREVLYTTSLFAAVLVAVFVFSGFANASLRAAAGPGVLWVCIAFVGTIVFSRTFQREREGHAIEGILLVPHVVDALYWAKFALNFALISLLQLALTPVVLGVFGGDAVPLLPLAITLIMGTFGYCALGTVLAAALAAVRMREVLLPLVLYPLCVPLLVSSVRATAALWVGDTAVGGWWQLLVAFDLLFLVLSRWLFAQAVDGGESG